MTTASAELLEAIAVVDRLGDVALTVSGQSELVPIVDALKAVVDKFVRALQSANPSLAVQVSAADAAAQAELAAKFPKAPGQG